MKKQDQTNGRNLKIKCRFSLSTSFQFVRHQQDWNLILWHGATLSGF